MGKFRDWIKKRAIRRELRKPCENGLDMPIGEETPHEAKVAEGDPADDSKREEIYKIGEKKGKKPANRAYMVVEDIPTGE